VLGTPAARPDDLDVAAVWEQVVDELEERRGRVSATVAVPGPLVRVVRDVLGRHASVLGDADDGRVLMRVSSHTARSVAEHLAGFGAAVEVLDAPDVRAGLATLGAELVALYAG
jgi:hypothetical protein